MISYVMLHKRRNTYSYLSCKRKVRVSHILLLFFRDERQQNTHAQREKHETNNPRKEEKSAGGQLFCVYMTKKNVRKSCAAESGL